MFISLPFAKEAITLYFVKLCLCLYFGLQRYLILCRIEEEQSFYACVLSGDDIYHYLRSNMLQDHASSNKFGTFAETNVLPYIEKC